MNRTIGIVSCAVTLAAVASFFVFLIIGLPEGSYLASIVIALGFVPMVCAFAAYTGKARQAAAFAAVAFAAVYAVFILVVYYAQLTVVRGALTTQAAFLLDYSRFGLFFTYDLLGYAFMALATLFTGLALHPVGRSDRVLRWLLIVHGVFFVSCTVMPFLGLFSPDMQGGDMIGTVVLCVWCVYFMPVCALSCRHFLRMGPSI